MAGVRKLGLLHRLGVLAAGLGLGVCACVGQTTSAPAPAPANKLTIDRLYSLPWLIGTRPENPQWSPDSQRVAFLWNDDGSNFHDVWIADGTQGKPVRVTRMPRLPMPADAGMDVARLEMVAKTETDHGVSTVAWDADSKRLFFLFRGKLFEAELGNDAAPAEPFERISGVTDLVSSSVSNRMAFVAGGDLWGLYPDGEPGAITRLYAAGKKDVAVEQPHLSPDGKQIAFIETDSSHITMRGLPDYLGDETKLTLVKRAVPGEPAAERRLGIVAATGGAPVWVDFQDDPQGLIGSFSWSPDSKTILVDRSDLYVKQRRLILVDAASGKATTRLREAGPKTVYPEWWADWAPDGKGFYFTSEHSGEYQVAYAGVDGGYRQVTSGKFEVSAVTVSAAANVLLLVTKEGRVEERQVFRMPLAGGAPERLTLAAGTHVPALSPDGLHFADVFSSDSVPPDLYVQSMVKGAPVQVTHSALPEFSEYRWVTPTYVDFPSNKDGANLHARLTLPPDFDPRKKYPAILGSVYSNTVRNQWGGRIAHPTWGLDQYLAQDGFVILNVDVAGSTGYGRAFRERIFEDYGGVDVEDLASGVKWLVAQGYVDPARVGIWGSSYGGLLTTMSLFAKPGLYKAGVAGAPATSLYHALTGEMRVMMAPQDHPSEYARASSFLRSGALEDHLMIIHGMRDQVVMFKDSVTLEQRLIEQGKDVDLVVLPGAPHPWDTEGFAQTRFAYKKLVGFFEKWLQPWQAGDRPGHDLGSND